MIKDTMAPARQGFIFNWSEKSILLGGKEMKMGWRRKEKGTCNISSTLFRSLKAAVAVDIDTKSVM